MSYGRHQAMAGQESIMTVFPPNPATDDPFHDLTPAEGVKDRTSQVFVSLFLILIAFFMVMNAVSNQVTARADAVMESVYTTFRKTHAPNSDEIDLLASAKLDIHSDEFYEAVQGLLAGLLDFPGTFASQGGDVLEAELLPSVLFARGQIHVRADQTLFLNSLADFLKKEDAGEERTVEIRFSASPQTLLTAAPEQELVVLRAAAFARELEDRGVPARSISAGLMDEAAGQRKEGRIWLTFRSRRVDILNQDRQGR
jgi:outer membrane protein OmpA-like peptidoglycan-associated protein